MVICVTPVGTCTTFVGPMALPRMVMAGHEGLPHSPDTYEPSDWRMMARTQTGPETPGWVALICKPAVAASAACTASTTAREIRAKHFTIRSSMPVRVKVNCHHNPDNRVRFWATEVRIRSDAVTWIAGVLRVFGTRADPRFVLSLPGSTQHRDPVLLESFIGRDNDEVAGFSGGDDTVARDRKSTRLNSS